MNALNRLVTTVLLVGVSALSLLFLLCLYHLTDPRSFGLYWHLEKLLDQALTLARASLTVASLATLGAIALSLGLLYFELSSIRPEPSVILHHDEKGTTRLDLSALADMVRWIGEESDGVEGMPRAAVRRRRSGILVTGLLVLNPYMNAPETASKLQKRLELQIEKTTGLPVAVRLKSRLQNPNARRRPK